MDHLTSSTQRNLLSKLMMPIALFGLSIVSAHYLVGSAAFWSLLELVPRSSRPTLMESLAWLLSPIQPAEVHTQEAQVEFVIAWLFSGIAILAFYFALRGMKAIFNVGKQHAP
jgi:hypothetical protein